jgi:hypothetical protein
MAPKEGRMAKIEIRDVVIWTKHLRNDDGLQKLLENLPEGHEVTLKIDGRVSHWEKMRTGKDGRPTNGLKPIGKLTSTWWREQFATRAGEFVDVSLAA